MLLCGLVSLWLVALSAYTSSFALQPPASQSGQTGAIPQAEREALIALYHGTNGDGWKEKGNWLGAPGTEGTWCGVTVEDGHVTALKINNNNLVGTIPPEIGKLTALKILEMQTLPFLYKQAGADQSTELADSEAVIPHKPPAVAVYAAASGLQYDSTPSRCFPGFGTDNHLRGSIPREIGNLLNLEYLDLSYNELSGDLPAELGSLTSLRVLRLNANRFERIPSEIGKLSRLELLTLYGNRLTSLPDALGNLASLQVLVLGGNQMASLPSGLGRLANLKSLWVSFTPIRTLPPELGNLKNLEELYLYNNLLERLPPEIGNLSALEELYLNNYSGSFNTNNRLRALPPEIGGLTSLKELYLDRNQLLTFPAEIGNLKNLETLSATDNQLVILPTEMGNMTGLKYLLLSNNKIRMIPPELAKLSNLSALFLTNNDLHGIIPPELGNLQALASLGLSSNQLSGRIPPELGKLSKLGSLDLSSNQLTGPIPPEIGNLRRLVDVFLNDNRLTGSIPSSIGNFEIVGRLRLDHNQLSGNLPAELGKLSHIYWFDVSSNRLSGSIPGEIRGLSALGNNAALQWNALYTKDPDLKSFLAKIIRYNLEATQTVAPENLRVLAATPTTVELRWDPIKYTGEAGGYRVFYGVSPGGPYTFFDETPNKTVSAMTVTGLDPKSARYYFAVRAVTYPHKNNQTAVVSDFGSEVSVVRGPVDFYFPFYQSSADTFTGFAVSNFSGETANLSFTGFDASGQPSPAFGAANFSLPPGHQLAMLGSEFLRSFQAGWVRLISDNRDIGSFFQFGGTDQLDGSSSMIGQSRKFYFTRVFEGPNAFRGQRAVTFLSIANPNDHPVSLIITLRGVPPGQDVSPMKITRTLSAKGWLNEPVSQIFGISSPSSNGYIEVEAVSGSGVVGFESIQLPESRTLIGLNASLGNVGNELYSAHLANEQLAYSVAFFTDLKLVNVSDEPRTLTVRAIYSGGFNLPVDLTLAPGEVLQKDVRDLFGALVPTASSIRIETSGPGVIGDVIFGDVFASRYAAAMPLQAQKFTRAVFSHVANAANFFTGIALYNPGSQPADVSVEVFSDQGVMTGQTSFQLGRASRISKLLAELLPSTAGQAGGYIVVRSNVPLVAQQLFGDAALNFLSAVPPTIADSAP